MLAASEAVHGPGIVIAAQSSADGSDAGRITDRDLQVLVNGLWYAGAEAVAVNDNRVGSLTSIRTAGDAITVNFRSISSPYTVIALGDTDTLRTRFAQNPAGRLLGEPAQALRRAVRRDTIVGGHVAVGTHRTTGPEARHEPGGEP